MGTRFQWLSRFWLSMLLVMQCGSGLTSAQSRQREAVKYQASRGNVKYLYATAEPVAHLRAGDVLDTNTLDCFGDAIQKPGDTLSMATGDNPLTGPFYIEGAEPGDTLAVRILDIVPTRDWAVSAFIPYFGGLTSTKFTRTLQPSLPDRVWVYQLRDNWLTCGPRTTWPGWSRPACSRIPASSPRWCARPGSGTACSGSASPAGSPTPARTRSPPTAGSA